MDYYYDDGTQACGPVDEEGMRALLSSGAVSADTHVWREGMAEWQRLGEVLPDLLPVPNATGPSGGSPSKAEEINFVVCSRCKRTRREDEISRIRGEPICASCEPIMRQLSHSDLSSARSQRERLRILQVARAQKGVIRCVLGILSLTLIVGVLSVDEESVLIYPIGLAAMAIWVMTAVYVYQLSDALGSNVPLLWALGVFASCCSVLIFWILVIILFVRATRTLRAAGVKVGLFGAKLRDLEAELQNG